VRLPIHNIVLMNRAAVSALITAGGRTVPPRGMGANQVATQAGWLTDQSVVHFQPWLSVACRKARPDLVDRKGCGRSNLQICKTPYLSPTACDGVEDQTADHTEKGQEHDRRR